MRHVIAALRTLCAIFFFVVYVSSFMLFSVITLRRWNQRISAKFLRSYGHISLWILGIPLKLKNEWPFAEDEPRVVIVNHQSTLDIVWFCKIAPGRISSIGKRELVWVPILNLAWWSLRFFYVDRANRESAIRTMREAADNTIRYQRSVCLSPEGTRSKDGRILPFKKGVFHIALEGNLPIYPIVMCGAAEAMPKKTVLAYPHPISLRFLPPISTEEWTLENLDEKIEKLRQQMIVAYDELRAEAGLPQLSSTP